MKLNPSEVSEILKREIGNIDQISTLNEVGYVVAVGDGIAKIYGIDNVQAVEMVEFASGVKGMVLNLETDTVGAVIMVDDRAVMQGDMVKRTGDILSTPVGPAMLGRVVDALGHPIGASGARVLTTLIHEMIKRNSKYGLAALCIGGGEASAVIVKKYE